ncbi:VIT1/CCC1 transporter family protein [Pseudooceanicola sp. HF7]|uniref:VIT1/CCC1 transporter family protein n=1 Tax=Pseudooceanicola sp. HF7 TaxID=2721560 RepID=UPI00142F7731|nr:VIT1/CCC1 transporter family protein [Pseudooceanicola sp. HF7]NIZ11400.1 GMP synthase [Pseudooceanicola sp. HF7]
MEQAQPERQPDRFARVQDFVKQIVYGGNDGIVTTFATVAGFAGASLEGGAAIGGLAVLVFGLANLFADGVSMGMGEFLSGRALRDLYCQRHRRSLRQIAEAPVEQRARFEGLLAQRGLDPEEAGATTRILERHPALMAEMELAWEHGMHDSGPDAPGKNGLVTFGSFLTFGVVPLVPYFLFDPTPLTFRVSVGATVLALTALGLLRWRATGERLGRTLLETVAVGLLCAGVAYVVGMLVGG